MARTFRIRWSEAALQDVESILEYITVRDGIGAASRVYDKLIERISALDSHPKLGADDEVGAAQTVITSSVTQQEAALPG